MKNIENNPSEVADDAQELTDKVVKTQKAAKAAIEFKVQQQAELLPFLFTSMSDKSRTTVKSFLTHRQVLVNNLVTTKHNTKLRVGDVVTISRGRSAAVLSHPMLKIVFEDDYIIVVDKRNGLLSMGTDREKEKTAYFILSNHVKRNDPEALIFIVHRLDRETSGLMLFAKSEKVQTILQHNWNEMVLERRYVAVVEGHLSKQEGVITAYLSENKGYKVFVSNKNEGEPAITKYKVLKYNDDFSLLELELETGKKNQIRAHLEYVGNPIAGDKKYGAQTAAGRVCLHAYVLSFTHPITGTRMDFSTRIPPLFESMI